jgi:hypothetical protein
MTNQDEGERYRKEAALALKGLRKQIHWKPEKALIHLEKRKVMGHLSPKASLDEYHRVIRKLIRGKRNGVLLYRFGSERYYTVRGTVGGVEWIVIVTREGVIETAFPPDAIDEYLTKRGFLQLGTIQEVLA